MKSGGVSLRIQHALIRGALVRTILGLRYDKRNRTRVPGTTPYAEAARARSSAAVSIPRVIPSVTVLRPRRRGGDIFGRAHAILHVVLHQRPQVGSQSGCLKDGPMRSLTILCLLAGMTAVGVLAADGLRPPKTLEALRLQRRALAHRKRRIIFNNDGDDAVYYNKAKTPEGMLEARTLPLVGSQVDTIFYSTSSCFPCFTHRTNVGERFTCREKGFRYNSVPALLARGSDPLHIMVTYCRGHDLEVFWSLRMNDTHDSSTSWYGPLLFPEFKKKHPEFLVGSMHKRPAHGPWSAVDYAHPEVRDLCFRIIQEVCKTYDVDGIELDFFRHACFFKTVAWGAKAGPAEWEAMTGLLRRVRRMTEQRGLERGRPILVAVRVPDSVEYCRGIGLDIERWLADGLVDMLTTTGYFRLNPWKTSVALGRRYGTPVYACLSESRIRGQVPPFSRNTLDTYCGRALRAWTAGVDGIYMFNYFNPHAALWREVGDPAGLARSNKQYFVTVRDGNPDNYLVDGKRWRTLPILTPKQPATLQPGAPRTFELSLGDDLSTAATAIAKPTITLHLLTVPAQALTVHFNGNLLQAGGCTGPWTNYPIAPDAVHGRVQRLSVTVAPGVEKTSRVAWTANHVPGFPWIREGKRKDTVAKLQGDAMLLADRGTEGGSYLFFQYPWNIRPGQAADVEAEVKVVSGWSSLDIADGAFEEEVQLFPDRIKARFLGAEHPVDLADRFHTVRVVLKGRALRVYVDGTSVIDTTGKLAHPAYSGRSIVAFGAANSPSRGEALWKSVTFSSASGGVMLFDAALSLEYPK